MAVEDDAGADFVGAAVLCCADLPELPATSDDQPAEHLHQQRGDSLSSSQCVSSG